MQIRSGSQSRSRHFFTHSVRQTTYRGNRLPSIINKANAVSEPANMTAAARRRSRHFLTHSVRQTTYRGNGLPSTKNKANAVSDPANMTAAARRRELPAGVPRQSERSERTREHDSGGTPPRLDIAGTVQGDALSQGVPS